MKTVIQDHRKIVWLASYPKSGNTWFRAFLTTLTKDGDLDINNLQTHGIFSNRKQFEEITQLDSFQLDKEKIWELLPEVYTQKAQRSQQPLFIKIHDAYSFNRLGKPIVPTEVSLGVIYLIRNPLDIAGSLANHMGLTITGAVNLMNREDSTLAKQESDIKNNRQLPQLMRSWSQHVESWVHNGNIPVEVLRYEDLLLKPVETFTKAVRFMGLQKSDVQIRQAVEATSFQHLKRQEVKNGFRERIQPYGRFFRKGKAGSWRRELGDKRIASLIGKHKNVMQQFGYLSEVEAFA
ncbi:MAG: sulfotransferase domain-containing protein [Bacteroidota bacterium]